MSGFWVCLTGPNVDMAKTHRSWWQGGTARCTRIGDMFTIAVVCRPYASLSLSF